MPQNTPLVLMILDGWGYSKERKHNAIAHAHTPQWDEWWNNCPHILLDASGVSVGLPNEQMGNSEVGHMHIGAGRIIQQDFTRINQAIAENALFDNKVLNEALVSLERTKKSLHIMGLFSPGGVHSHEEHLFALIKLFNQKKVHTLYLHLFLDGRDTPPQSALESLARLELLLKEYPAVQIGSISGRYYAMDRDKRWDRIESTYNLLTQGVSTHCFADAKDAIQFYYQKGISDEFIPPTALNALKPISDGDTVLFFNFRADRARQLSAAFISPEFNEFSQKLRPKLSYFITLTQYDKTLPTSCVFPPISMSNTLGELIANQGLTQLRIAETEKYAHVTFFFNGGNEQTYKNEKRILIPSPKVATYDLQPEMSAPKLTDELVAAISKRKFDVIICNYANADMVGHSGNFNATIAAIECLDACMRRVWKALESVQGTLLITADHGNAEEMFDEHTHQAHTAHTTEPVPLVYVGGGWHFTQSQGSLIDIAPSILALLNIKPPPEMTGHILLEQDHDSL
jgi:2,3-bisphosphoglycerate-independent phosphoglycerate mutase